MQTLSLTVFIIFFTVLAFSSPQKIPDGFLEVKNLNGNRLFANKNKNIFIGVKRQTQSQKDSYKMLQYFNNRVIINHTTSYYSLNSAQNAIARIYFKVHESQLVQATITMQSNSKNETLDLDKTIMPFLE